MGVERFPGFPASAEATAVPNAFFAQVLPQIDTAAELAVSTYVFFALGRLRRFPRYVTDPELAAEAPLMQALDRLAGDAPAGLAQGLQKATERGTLLRVELDRAGRREELYLLNTPAGRRDAARIRAGVVTLGRPVRPEPAGAVDPTTIFRLYEDTFGTLSPSVVRELELAEEEYPAAWIERAFRDAAVYKAKNWGYVQAILRRWREEGRPSEEAERRDTGVDEGSRYTRGRYGQYVD